jgi:hypothetical protein
MLEEKNRSTERHPSTCVALVNLTGSVGHAPTYLQVLQPSLGEDTTPITAASDLLHAARRPARLERLGLAVCIEGNVPYWCILHVRLVLRMWKDKNIRYCSIHMYRITLSPSMRPILVYVTKRQNSIACV